MPNLTPSDTLEIRELMPDDYDGVIALWLASDGVTIRDVDQRAPLSAYLIQHRGLSFVAVDAGTIVGSTLCGTDGRRGYLQHVAVATSHRRRGIGRTLVDRSINALAERGIDKCHLMVLVDNVDAAAFWKRIGWTERSEIRLMSNTASRKPNA
jgi:ribosomal protein S18 acetylase RimI-like enzyme